MSRNARGHEGRLEALIGMYQLHGITSEAVYES